jgi:hypothetical protein
MEAKYESFGDYFKNESPSAFKIMSELNMPSSFEEILIEFSKCNNMINDIDNLQNNKFIPEDFIIYLNHNLTNSDNRHHNHSVKILSEGDFENTWPYMSPEIRNTIWIDFKTTKVWLDKLKEDGFL